MSVTINKVTERKLGWVVSASVEGHTFEVEVNETTLNRLGAKTPEAIVTSTLRFLLARERVDEILSEFNLHDVSKYFPEYEALVSEY